MPKNLDKQLQESQFKKSGYSHQVKLGLINNPCRLMHYVLTCVFFNQGTAIIFTRKLMFYVPYSLQIKKGIRLLFYLKRGLVSGCGGTLHPKYGSIPVQGSKHELFNLTTVVICRSESIILSRIKFVVHTAARKQNIHIHTSVPPKLYADWSLGLEVIQYQCRI